MATSVNTSLPMWLTGCTYDGNSGNDLRNSMVTAMFYDPGIITSSTIGVRSGVVGGAGLFVQPGTGMQVLVQPGSYVVAASSSPINGAYVSTLASQAALTVQTADPTNSRIDLIVAVVSDTGTSASFGAVQIITGTPAPTPVAPSTPANSITLAQLTVPAAASSITSGMLADQRPFTTTTGGILRAAKGSVAGYNGQVAWDPSSGAFYHNSASGAQQLRTLPWSPVTLYNTTDTVSTSGAVVTVLSTTITTDGSTDIGVYVKGTGIYLSASHGEFAGNLQVYIDSTLIDELVLFNTASDGVVRGGAAFTAYTNASQGTTPSAGTHTIYYKFQSLDASGVSVRLRGATISPNVMRVFPLGA